ncbi:uncharacterized protein LOC117587650 [Drosophila guanche]|uniref:F-box/LRR-repeat protein 21 n=1 Tax=Drosophila guanche TaxID=7266 RepID=A0A3B0KBG1_DROGU|nr:uncharacterized protein LOC117587650 [Drosophila guanche]XP_034134432.1 uncharacterized protein LOC117587650 [Drosophila guanche]SPP85490.1 Hypothetical predicted protein [Drosophila guanche]
MNLLQLHDDCLDDILLHFGFDELLPLFNQLNRRFDDAIERQLHRFRYFQFSMRHPPAFNEGLMLLLGRHLNSLHITVGYSTSDKDILKYLNPLCQGASESLRLHALKLDHAKWSPDIVNAVCKVASSLLFLDMRHCDVRDYQITRLLESADKMEALALLHVHNQTGESYLQYNILRKMPALKLIHITILGILPFSPEELSQQCPHLSFLISDLINSELKIYGPPAYLQDYYKYYHAYFKTP